MTKVSDLTGKVFGRLTVLSYAGTSRCGSLWTCACECGSVVIKRGSNLSYGTTKSCGCFHPVVKLGNKGTRLKNIWKHMKSRCVCKTDKDFYKYGARGICVCAEWSGSFIPFKKWALNNGYDKILTLDRINNEGNYEPSNCRWTTQKVQQNNRRNNILVEIKGRSMSPLQISKEYGIDLNCVYARLKRGDVEQALVRPTKIRIKQNSYFVEYDCRHIAQTSPLISV